jgi:hypothetical protein
VIADDDFIRYCLKNYHTPVFSREEFESDLNKLVILKKMFKRYDTTGQINIRLILNNIIILVNVFGIESANIILFYRLGEDYYSLIKTFLTFLNSYVDNDVTKDVELNDKIWEMLKREVS